MIKDAIFILSPFFLPLLFRVSRKKPTVFLLWVITLVCQCVSITNGYFFRTIGADVDAMLFHQNAISISQTGSFYFGMWADFYTNFLAGLYFFSGSQSIIIGQSMSISFYILSLIVFLKLRNLLNLGKYRNISIILLGLLPSMFLFGSITLRESYEIFFFIFSIYYFIKYFQFRKKESFFISVISAIIMGMFHPGLFLYSLMLISVFLFGLIEFDFYVLFSKFHKWYVCLPILLLMLIVVLIYKLNSIENVNVVNSLINGDIIQYSRSYRHLLIQHSIEHGANATYGVEFQIDSIISFVKSSVTIVSYYYLSPFPWEIYNIKGLYSFFENLWRIVLIAFSIRLWFVSRRKKKMVGFLLLSYFGVSMIFALGTVNYGTAIRHHLIGYWILILLGAPILIKNLQGVLKILYKFISNSFSKKPTIKYANRYQ